MTESKIELVHRWTHEKRLQLAADFRAEARRRHRSEGRTKQQAREEAWAETARAFPALSQSENS